MKRLVMIVLVFLCIGAALSAQGFSMSAGLGGNFTYGFNSYTLSKDAKDAGMKAEDENGHLIGGGIYTFFDATYVEANIGFLFGNANADKIPSGASDAAKKGMDITALKLGLFGKYPVDLGGATVFPMLGIDGQINLGGKMGGEEIPSSYKDDFNKMFTYLWFKAGLGFDIPLPVADNKLFIRPEFLYGIRLNTKSEQDAIAGYDVQTGVDSNGEAIYTKIKSYDAIIGHGLDIRLAIGYRFY